MHNGGVHNGQTPAEALIQIVNADGSTGGFLKDSQASAFALTLMDDVDARAFAATAGLGFPLAHSNVAVAITGTTDETAAATIAIPAGAMGANGRLRITTHWHFTNSGNSKTLRVRLGGVSGTMFYEQGVTTFQSLHGVTNIANVNSASIQYGHPDDTAGFGAIAAAPVTGAINTALAQDLVISGQLADSGETITLAGYLVELFYKA